MTNDDSEQIAAARRRGRPHAATRESVGRQSMREVVVRTDRQPPVVQIAGSALRPTAKFSSLQSLENSQNGERISIFRTSPVSQRNGPTDQVGAAHGRLTIKAFSPGPSSASVDRGLDRDREGADRKWRRNSLKTLNQRPEMVASRKPRSHKMWYTGARLTVRSD